MSLRPASTCAGCQRRCPLEAANLPPMSMRAPLSRPLLSLSRPDPPFPLSRPRLPLSRPPLSSQPIPLSVAFALQAPAPQRAASATCGSSAPSNMLAKEAPAHEPQTQTLLGRCLGWLGRGAAAKHGLSARRALGAARAAALRRGRGLLAGPSPQRARGGARRTCGRARAHPRAPATRGAERAGLRWCEFASQRWVALANPAPR